MTDLTTQNILKYVVAIVAGSLAAALGVLVVQLAGTDPIQWRPVIAAGLGPIVTGLATMQLTRVGSEPIAAQVDSLKAGGTQKRDMVVVSQDEAVPMLGGALTPTQRAQILADLKAELIRDPEGDDPPAPDPRPADHVIAAIDRAEDQRAGGQPS